MKDRILVLDDDEETLVLVSMFLQNEGYEVFKCDHLYEDLTEVAVLSPGAMIVDWFMGDKDAGWEFLQRLQAYTPTAGIPLMLYSAGRLTPEQHHHTHHQGITVLDKPFDLTDLLHLVQTLVASSRSPVE